MLLQRLEQRSAIVIQRAVRKYLRILYWKKFLRANSSATRIQKCWKGFVTRRWFMRYIRERDRVAAMMQAMARGRQARILLRDMMDEREVAATEIQRFVRAVLLERRVKQRLLHKMALRIQCLWRGERARARADRQYLEDKATLIQKHVRRHMQRLTYRRLLKEQTEAAVICQTAFRSFLAKNIRTRKLWERGTNLRANSRALLAAEEDFLLRRTERMTRALVKANYDHKIAQLELAFETEVDTIMLNEFDLVNMQNEYTRLSPRGLQQGWAKQLLVDQDKYRAGVSEHKAKALFKVAREQRKLRRLKQEQEDALKDALGLKKYLRERWIADRNAAHERQNEFDWGVRKLNLAKDAGAEKRKWKVHFYTDTGKPDLKRSKPRHAWNPDDFPFKDSRTWNVMHGDITALAREERPSTPERKRQERVEYLKMRHFLSMYGPGTAMGLGEAEHYAPDMLPHPMTHEEVEDSVLQGFMPMGAQASANMDFMGIRGYDGRVPTRAGLFAAAGGTGMAAPVPPSVAMQPPPPGAAAAPVGLPPVGPGMPAANMAEVPDDMTWGGGATGPAAMLGAGFVGEDGLWRPAAGQAGESFAFSGDPRLGAHGEPLGPPGVHPSAYALGVGAPSALPTAGSRPGTGLSGVSRPRSRPGTGLTHIPNLPLDAVGGRPGTAPTVPHTDLAPQAQEVDAAVRRGLLTTPADDKAHKPGAASLASFVMEEVVAQHRKRKAEHLQRMGLDPATRDGTIDAEGNLLPSTRMRGVPLDVKAAAKQGPGRFAGGGHDEAATETTDHRATTKLQDVIKRSGVRAVVKGSTDAAVVGGLDERTGQRTLPAYLTSVLGTSKQESLDALNPEVASAGHSVDAAWKQKERDARMPPGLAAARRAEAAATLAQAQAEGRIGRTQVNSSAAEKQELAEKELAEFQRVGHRVHSLVDKLGAMSGQMELVQYGALLKPAFGAMAKVMDKLGAGPKGPHDKAAESKAAHMQRMRGRLAKAATKTDGLGGESCPSLPTVPEELLQPSLGFGEAGGLGDDEVRFTADDGDVFIQPVPAPDKKPKRRKHPSKVVRPASMLDELW